MPNFYGTFGQGKAFSLHYVEIEAANEEQARKFMFEHYGANFMTVYTEEGFANQPEQYGLERLLKAAVINHGDNVRPHLEYKLK